jgi:hypothetical protein
MGYFGNAYRPRDDAPHCAEVMLNAQANTSLMVATGRPRIFYVVYPWQGMEVFCEGAVVPYFEFESRERLTDEQWRTRLSSPERPAAPSWISPISLSATK